MQSHFRLAAVQTERPEYAIHRRWLHLRNHRLIRLSADIAHLQDTLGIAIELAAAPSDLEKATGEKSYNQPSPTASQTKICDKLWEQLDTKLKLQGVWLPTSDYLLY